jgi:putative AdoMet-dependent methyltransferase
LAGRAFAPDSNSQRYVHAEVQLKGQKEDQMTSDKWQYQYQEQEHPGADFDALAEGYDKVQGRFRDIQGEIEEILEFLDLKADQTVLEIGTGTGEMALAAAPHCARVYAVDLSAGMLRFAKRKAASRGVDNVDFLPGGFLSYRHLGAPLDAIVSQLALHHLPDFWQQVALMRMAGMLKEGGKLCLMDMVYSFDVREYRSFFPNYMDEVSKSVDPDFADKVAFHVQREYSTMDWIMEGMIERAGFEVERVRKTDGFLALYLCRKVG